MMERILAMDEGKALKLMSVTFNDDGYATLGTGDPLYRVYKSNAMTLETKNLFDAYLWFARLGGFLPKPIPTDTVLMVTNSRYSKKPKVFGLFKTPLLCVSEIYEKLPYFMKKKGNEEMAGINLLEHFFRDVPLDVSHLPYLKLERVQCDRLLPG